MRIRCKTIFAGPDGLVGKDGGIIELGDIAMVRALEAVGAAEVLDSPSPVAPVVASTQHEIAALGVIPAFIETREGDVPTLSEPEPVVEPAVEPESEAEADTAEVEQPLVAEAALEEIIPEDAPPVPDDTPISDLGLDTDVVKKLVENGLINAGAIREFGDLTVIKGIGRVTADLIRVALGDDISDE